MPDPSLPSRAFVEQQAAWLAPARARLLRRVAIARRRHILDLACGYGAVVGELVRRGGGRVVALDRSRRALSEAPEAFQGAVRIQADATQLPFRDGSFDLVFCQFAFLWLDGYATAREISRVLRPGGVLVALEPDFGGLIEHPSEIASREVWLRAITRAGGDPEIGRKLPGILSAIGLAVRVDLLDRLEPPSPDRFALLGELPLEPEEVDALKRIEAASRSTPGGVAHLPVFLITATRPS